MYLFCYALLCAHSSFAIILKRKGKLVALLLAFRCIVTISDLWLFFMVPWVGLLCVIVVFPDHTHLLFTSYGFLLIFLALVNDIYMYLCIILYWHSKMSFACLSFIALDNVKCKKCR